MIRKFKKEDRECYINMASEFYNSDAVLHPVPRTHFERTVSELLASDVYVQIYMIEHEDKPAGYGLISKTFSQEAGGPVIWVEELYVRPQYRSKGLGREFFSYLEKKYEGTIARFRLEVEAENKRAVSLYERQGYKMLDYVQMIKE